MIDINHVADTNNIMSIAEQLKSKFIISLEGGDVGTALKWILYSK